MAAPEYAFDYRTAFLSSLDSNAALLDKQGDIVTVNENWKSFALANDALIPAISVGVNYADVCRKAASDSPDARAVLDGLLAVLAGTSKRFRWEYRCDAPEIQRWFAVAITPWHAPEGGALVSHTDISEHKLALEMHERALNYVRAIVWTADAPSFGTTSVYGQVEEILGFPTHAWLNNRNLWMDRIDPRDREWVLRYTKTAVAEGRNHEFDYRMLAADGHTVWLRQIVSVVCVQGQPTYLVGASIDVTELHQVQEELQSVSGRLLKAQDEERARIARELHDDFNQRIALVSVNLESLEHFSGLEAKAKSCAKEINEQVRELGNDIHALSHRLHSSKLDYLGLAVACRGFCTELSGRQNVEIDFRSENIPEGLSKEVSLCLFRILQEALQNAVKYSGVRSFRVFLNATSDEVELTVSDAGSGFDPDEAMNGQGLGLTSMRERLKLVDGQLSIESRAGQGTTIRARVPLSPEKAASASS